jgi:hypothetical protein
MDRIIHQIVVIVMMLMTSSVAVAGYTDALHAIDENVSDCGDWSGISNSPDKSLRSYFYRFHRGDLNQAVMWDPATWGLLSSTRFVDVGGRADDVSWGYVCIHGFKHTLIDENGVVYTDDPTEVYYTTGYCGYKGFRTKHWITYEVTNQQSVSVHGNACVVTNDVTVKCECKDNQQSATTRLSDRMSFMKWVVPDHVVHATITNCSGRVYLLEVSIPANVTGISIATNAGEYMKHAYHLLRNTSDGFEWMELRKHVYEDSNGLAPCGRNLFASREPITDVSVKLHTPFDAIDADVVIVHAEEEEADPRETPVEFFNILVICIVLYFLVMGLLK